MTALDEAVTEALWRGCRVQDRSEGSVTLIEPKKFDPLGCLLLGGLPYLLWFGLVQRDAVWYVELQDDGSLLWNGRPLKEVKQRQGTKNLLLAVGFWLALAACCWLAFEVGADLIWTPPEPVPRPQPDLRLGSGFLARQEAD